MAFLDYTKKKEGRKALNLKQSSWRHKIQGIKRLRVNWYIKYYPIRVLHKTATI